MEDICGVCNAAAYGFFPQSPFSQVLELQWEFKHFSLFQQVKALAVLCQAVQASTELCLWSVLENTSKFPLPPNLPSLFPLILYQR